MDREYSTKEKFALATGAIILATGLAETAPTQAADLTPAENTGPTLHIDNPYISFEGYNHLIQKVKIEAQKQKQVETPLGFATPAPASETELNLINSAEPAIGVISAVELFTLMQENTEITDAQKLELLTSLSNIEQTKDYISKQINPNAVYDINTFSSVFSVIGGTDNSLHLVSYITNMDEISDGRDTIAPNSILFTYPNPETPSLPLVGSFSSTDGASYTFLPDMGGQAIPVTSFSQAGELVLNTVPVQGSDGRPVEAYAADVLFNSEQLPSLYRFQMTEVDGQLKTDITRLVAASNEQLIVASALQSAEIFTQNEGISVKGRAAIYEQYLEDVPARTTIILQSNEMDGNPANKRPGTLTGINLIEDFLPVHPEHPEDRPNFVLDGEETSLNSHEALTISVDQAFWRIAKGQGLVPVDISFEDFVRQYPDLKVDIYTKDAEMVPVSINAPRIFRLRGQEVEDSVNNPKPGYIRTQFGTFTHSVDPNTGALITDIWYGSANDMEGWYGFDKTDDFGTDDFTTTRMVAQAVLTIGKNQNYADYGDIFGFQHQGHSANADLGDIYDPNIGIIPEGYYQYIGQPEDPMAPYYDNAQLVNIQ